MSDYRIMTAYHIGQWLAKMYVGERGSGAPLVEVPGWVYRTSEPCTLGCKAAHGVIAIPFEMPCQWAVTN